MTKICLKRDLLFGYSKITVSGHSGYAEEGNDIICAYISSATDLIMCILIDKLGADVITDIDSGKPFVGFTIRDTDNNSSNADVISLCLDGFAEQMKELSKQYPKFVSITIA